MVVMNIEHSSLLYSCIRVDTVILDNYKKLCYTVDTGYAHYSHAHHAVGSPLSYHACY